MHLKMCASYLILCLFFAHVPNSRCAKEEFTTIRDQMHHPGHQRQGKLLPIFQIVTFPNDPCTSGTRNGTCYTAEECNSRSGTSSGGCASGYGVCCIFQRTCGQMTTENCTYFVSPATVPTMTDCTLTVCPCSSNICQVRLDFNTFVITGPSTSTVTVGKTVYGDFVKTTDAINMDAVLVSNAGQCLTDLFSLTSPGNAAPPNVCGTLTGEHMYADLNSGCCDELRFSLSDNVNGGAATATRTWDIKITQYSCDFDNLAPEGCTKYFFGSSTGMFNNYNFGNQHLADQNELNCFRREQGFCRICFVPTAVADFMLSAPTTFKSTQTKADNSQVCCAYGNNGISVIGYDCIEIPGVTGTQGGAGDPINSRFCGRSKGFDTIARTVCTSFTPFQVRFRSDRYEFLNSVITSEGAAPDNGFRLAYTMDTMNCN